MSFYNNRLDLKCSQFQIFFIFLTNEDVHCFDEINECFQQERFSAMMTDSKNFKNVDVSFGTNFNEISYEECSIAYFLVQLEVDVCELIH